MSLAVDIRHRLGDFEVDARFETSGRLTALFGRSGAGKTTIVNAIAGLFRPHFARIAVDGLTFLDTERRITVAKHRRRVGYVFQEGRLFPHLTVRQNLRYGAWFAGREEQGPAPFDEVVTLLGIGQLMKRRPSDLSGGEKQRVAIGRALLAAPRLLLMDEPLASLDEERKAELLPYIERLRDEVRLPIVYVSHSLAEVARLADNVVVLAEGRVAEVGPVAQVLARPSVLPLRERQEAGGILTARVAAHDERHGLTVLRSAAGDIFVPRLAVDLGKELRVRIRARDVMLSLGQPAGLSALNVLPARVLEVHAAADASVDVALAIGGERLLARITRRSVERLGIEPGRPVFAVLKSVAIEAPDIGSSFDEL